MASQVQLPGNQLVRVGAHMPRYTITTVEIDITFLQAEAYQKVHEACTSNLIPPAVANDGQEKTRPIGIDPFTHRRLWIATLTPTLDAAPEKTTVKQLEK